MLTLNALSTVDEVLLPLQPHFLALHGLSKLLQTIDLVARRLNPKLRLSGVVYCMYESGTRLAAEVTNDVDEALLLATRIVLLDQGRVVQIGTPLELLAHPATPFVVDFVGRSDIGIKLLSLMPASALARRASGPSIGMNHWAVARKISGALERQECG